MKYFYALIFILFSFTISAQPTGYYNSALGSGYTLKTQLKRIIDDVDNGLAIEYISIDNGYSGLYDIYESSDRDIYFENNGTVLDMYSENPTGPDAYEYTYEIEVPDDRDPGLGGTSEGEYYNREHIIPQSVFDSNDPMRNDAHFVVPSDKYVNAQRGNLPFGKVQTANYTSSNGSKRGNNLNSGYSTGYSSTVFEPINEFKGDIARMFFYFVTRYEDGLTSFNSYDMFNGSANQAFEQTFLNIIYTWHVQDPVSKREQDRNNEIFIAQNNRNPFIDHPEYVQSIWGSLLSNKDYNTLGLKIYPNPLKGNYLNIETSKDLNVEIFDILGKQVLKSNLTSNSNRINVGTLNKGIYIVRLISEDGQVTRKLIKQ
jgi:endonuclease I